MKRQTNNNSLPAGVRVLIVVIIVLVLILGIVLVGVLGGEVRDWFHARTGRG